VRQKRHLVQWAALGALIACTTGALPAWSADANKAVDDYNFAAWLYNTGKYSLAVESYEAFLKNHPDHAKLPDARFGLAQSHFHLDAFAKAIEQYTILRDDYPDFPQRAEARFQLGQSQVALEQFAPAEATFQAVVEQHADHYLADWAMARRAACLTSLGRHAEAEALLLPLMAAYHAENRSPGDMPATKAMLEKLDAAGVSSPILVHPRAWVGRNVALGPGTQVAAGAMVSTDVTVGRHVIVNQGSSVAHDVALDDFATLAPGVRLSGAVRVGEGADVGTGAVVIQGLTIGAWSICGAGAVVVSDVPANTTVVGVPAKVIKERSAGWHEAPSDTVSP